MESLPPPTPNTGKLATTPTPAVFTVKDLRRIAKGMEWVREELGPDIDFGIEAHWKYDTRDAINMAKAIGPVKPMWLEDPVPPENP